MPENHIDLVLLAKAIDWQYTLDQYSDDQAKLILGILDRSQAQLTRKLTRAAITEWSKARTKALLDEVQDLTLGIRQKITGDIGDVTATAGAASYTAHSEALSFGGAAKNVTTVAMTASTLKSIITTVPIGGNLLSEWVDKSLSSHLKDRIRAEVAAGLIDGDSYAAIVKRLKQGWQGAKHELETITKTYVSSINSQAMQDVFTANKDIVKTVQWRAALSNRTCLRCSGLDGHSYPVNDHPPIPLHPRCRCVLLPKTDGKEALGLSQKDLDEAARPYSIKEGKIVGLGSKGKVVDAGTWKGNYESWLNQLSPKQRLDFLGPKRLELIEAGMVKFDDLVDTKTGRLRLLAELTK